MALWDTFKRVAISNRITEERIYELVLKEIESGERRGGLWLKAIEDSRGDERQAKILYIKYRVQSMKDELDISSALVEAAKNEPAPQMPIDAYDSDGHTRLMKAVLSDDLAQVRSLVEQGADIRIKDNTFGTSTALDMAHLSLRRSQSPTDTSLRSQIIDALEIASQRI